MGTDRAGDCGVRGDLRGGGIAGGGISIYDMHIIYHPESHIMSRILVDLPDSQVEQLTLLAETERRPRAVVIREAIAAYLVERRPQAAPEVFGLWKNRGADGLQYQQKLREEW